MTMRYCWVGRPTAASEVRSMSRPMPLVLCALALTPQAEAAEPSGSSLTAQCRAYVEDPASEQGQRCAAFIAGFLAGLTTSEAAEATSRTETYSERALRTRLGVRLVGRQSDACVNPSTSHEVLIGQLLAHAAEQPPDDDATASTLLRDTLVRFHACDLLERRRSL
jgi:hypothetical protein